MNKLAATAVVIAAIAAAAAGASSSLLQDQEDALTAIDTVPSKALYESLQLDQPLDQTTLQAVASDGSASPALRLRAIHALSTYCVIPPMPNPQLCPENDPAHQTLSAVIAANGSAQSGADLLILRAAIEAIGPMRVSTDVNTLTGLLNHPSRDIRATTAFALGALCNTAAITPLHQRLTNESTEQVKLAISAALRMLSVCP
jgi:HEAT repeat protein